MAGDGALPDPGTCKSLSPRLCILCPHTARALPSSPLRLGIGSPLISFPPVQLALCTLAWSLHVMTLGGELCPPLLLPTSQCVPPTAPDLESKASTGTTSGGSAWDFVSLHPGGKGHLLPTGKDRDLFSEDLGCLRDKTQTRIVPRTIRLGWSRQPSQPTGGKVWRVTPGRCFSGSSNFSCQTPLFHPVPVA